MSLELKAKKWAGAHPIRYSISDRETTLSRAAERDSSGSLSTGEAVAETIHTPADFGVSCLRGKAQARNQDHFRGSESGGISGSHHRNG